MLNLHFKNEINTLKIYTHVLKNNGFSPINVPDVATLHQGAPCWLTLLRMRRGTPKLLQTSKTPLKTPKTSEMPPIKCGPFQSPLKSNKSSIIFLLHMKNL